MLLQLLLWTSIFLLLQPDLVFAWGHLGHRLVAELAEDALTPRVRQHVAVLIGSGGLVSVANWADEIRKDRPETATWHYVNLPAMATSYEVDRDCATPSPGDCVVSAITRFTDILGDRTRSIPERAEALKFLVHLIADVHQPLHCLAEDVGGNFKEVVFFGETVNELAQRPWNLHAVWDAGLLERSGSEADLLATLKQMMHQQRTVTAPSDGPAAWALESNRLAVEVAYTVGPYGRIGAPYAEKALPVIHRRLVEGALRLSAWLNKALGAS